VEAARFIPTLQKRQGLQVACPKRLHFARAGSPLSNCLLLLTH
jgi:hypothetical protein